MADDASGLNVKGKEEGQGPSTNVKEDEWNCFK
jgi:hypothetical protein